MGNNRYDGIDDYGVKLIRHKARQLVGRAGLVEADRHDLEQDMALDLLRRLPRFDPARAGRKTFIARAVRYRTATLVEGQTAGVRDYRRVAGSLDQRRPVDDGASDDGVCDDGPPVLDQHEYRREVIATARRDEELHHLRHDLTRALPKLPPDLLHLCVRLGTDSVSEVSRDTGVPRSTLYDAIGKVRGRFERVGLAA